MKRIVYGLIVILAILHQDYWLWNDSETLLFGVAPAGLAYHVGVSIVAAILWALAVRFCWPEGLDDDLSTAGANGDQS